jgi:hypothetical protein
MGKVTTSAQHVGALDIASAWSVTIALDCLITVIPFVVKEYKIYGLHKVRENIIEGQLNMPGKHAVGCKNLICR